MSNKPGRNVPCPCGSGKKYKRCCLTADEAAARDRAREHDLWDEEFDAETDDDSFLDVEDDEPALDVRDLVRVCYTRGLVQRVSDLRAGRGVQVTEWAMPDIPRGVLESIEAEAVDALEGEWGDPRAGDPMQVDIIDLETDSDRITIQVFNRAISLGFADSEDMRRIHRVCCALESAARNSQNGPGADEAAPAAAARPNGTAERHTVVDLSMVVQEHHRLGGTCALCGEALTRAGAREHLAACAPAHDVVTGPEKELLHVRVTSPGLPAYWLDLEVRADTKLEALDKILRQTWLECCGHLSSFSIGSVTYFSHGYQSMGSFGGWSSERRIERRMTVKVAEALPAAGTRFDYEYDFGSTTMLQLVVVDQRTGCVGRHTMRLLARNTPPIWPCATCGQPADSVCSLCLQEGADAFTCARHTAEHACGETDGLMPVVNSPRMGVCGYGVDI